jgi:phosphate transport system substrate-binding protein
MSRSATVAALTLGAAFLAPVATLADTSISAAGSTALQPLVTAAAAAYQAQHGDVKISVTGGGSKTGLSLVGNKAVDLGDSDILAPAGTPLVDHKVAVIGFSVVVNPASGVTNLSKHQIQDVFSGKVTNWKDVGGKDQAITVINRPASSGTRAVFVKTLMGSAALSKDALTEDATGTVVQKVKQSPGAVSYASFSGTHNQTGLTEVSVDGAPANEESVESGKYPFWSYEHIYTNGQPSEPVAAFIAFVSNDKELMAKTGYILVHDMKVSETDR